MGGSSTRIGWEGEVWMDMVCGSCTGSEIVGLQNDTFVVKLEISEKIT